MFTQQASFPVLGLIQDAPPVSPVLLIVVAILLVILFIWLLLRDRRARDETAASRAVKTEPAAVPSPAMRSESILTEAVETPAAPVIDDLEIIEGIGPKIASVLNQAGVTSFAQLAAMDPAQITDILQAENLRLADPGSWPEQARLAANGDMAGLQALQDRLKGGR